MSSGSPAAGEPVTPAAAGWRYLGFSVHTLTAPTVIGRKDHETAIVVLAGGAAQVDDLELPGRASVWDGLPSAAYLPPGSSPRCARLKDR